VSLSSAHPVQLVHAKLVVRPSEELSESGGERPSQLVLRIWYRLKSQELGHTIGFLWVASEVSEYLGDIRITRAI
jgi:hypothetical protein